MNCNFIDELWGNLEPMSLSEVKEEHEHYRQHGREEYESYLRVISEPYPDYLMDTGSEGADDYDWAVLEQVFQDRYERERDKFSRALPDKHLERGRLKV